MPAISAVDAIYPAYQRTREILAQPFRLGRTTKLATCGYVAVMGSMFFPVPLIFLGIQKFSPNLPPGAGVAFAVAGGFLTLLMLAFFYLGSRMQFVVFDIVLNLSQTVAPAWRRYGSRSLSWTGFKLVVCVIASCILWILFLPHLRDLIEFGSQLHAGPQAGLQSGPPLKFIESIFATYGLVLGGVYGLMFLLSLLSDFVLPSMALEGMSPLAATRRFIDLIAFEPAAIGGFLFVKLGLIAVGFFGMQAAAMIVMIPCGILAFIVGSLGYAVLHGMLHLGTVVLLPLAIVLGLCVYGFFMMVVFLVHGTAVIFLQAFSLYFLGSRYKLLGDDLHPDPSRPYTPPPSLPSRDERDDDDGGPTLPMNPVIA